MQKIYSLTFPLKLKVENSEMAKQYKKGPYMGQKRKPTLG